VVISFQFIAILFSSPDPFNPTAGLAPFCQAVSEEKIFLNSGQSETRIALGGHICWWNGMK
jgi:hypothetical protein